MKKNKANLRKLKTEASEVVGTHESRGGRGQAGDHR